MSTLYGREGGGGGPGAGIHGWVGGGLERVHMRAAARAALRLGEKVPPRAARRAGGAKARRLASPDARHGAVAELENEEDRRRVRQQHADLQQRRGSASAGGAVLEPVRNGRAIQGCRDCSPETQNAKEALSDETGAQRSAPPTPSSNRVHRVAGQEQMPAGLQCWGVLRPQNRR